MDASIAPELAALLAEADALRRIVALDADERERERESARASESEKTGQLTDKLRSTNEQVLSLLALLLVSSYKSTRCARENRAARRPLSPFPPLEMEEKIEEKERSKK